MERLVYMTRLDSPRLQFGLILLRGYPDELVDHGGGDSGLPAGRPAPSEGMDRSQVGRPDAEAGLPGFPASHQLWGDADDIRAWHSRHPGLWLREAPSRAAELAGTFVFGRTTKPISVADRATLVALASRHPGATFCGPVEHGLTGWFECPEDDRRAPSQASTARQLWADVVAAGLGRLFPREQRMGSL
jgi:hypothetical protein